MGGARDFLSVRAQQLIGQLVVVVVSTCYWDAAIMLAFILTLADCS